MSTINGRQQVGHGTGGGFASIDNVAFSRGAWGGWIDDDRAFFANGDDNWIASVYVQSSGAIRRAVLNPANPQYAAGWNSGYAGGGVWAGWLAGTGPQRGLFTSDGWHAPDAGLLAVGATTGAIGHKPQYQSTGPTICREPDGTAWQITPGHAYDLDIVGRRQAIWQEGNYLRVAGLPIPQQVGRAWRPQAHYINGAWWVSYYSDAVGIVLHPFASTDGIVVVPVGVDAWHTARAFGTVVLFALSSSEAEQPGQIRRQAYDVTAVPLSPLVPPPDPGPTPPDPVPPDPVPPDPGPTPPDPTPPKPDPPKPPSTPYVHHRVYAMR